MPAWRIHLDDHQRSAFTLRLVEIARDIIRRRRADHAVYLQQQRAHALLLGADERRQRHE